VVLWPSSPFLDTQLDTQAPIRLEQFFPVTSRAGTNVFTSEITSNVNLTDAENCVLQTGQLHILRQWEINAEAKL